MTDKMRPNEVFVNVPDVVNEEEVGDEHVEDVIGERVPQTQIGGLRDDEGDTM